jgi:hypothetical protein
MKLDYSFFTTAVVEVATDMLIDAVSERRLDNADELGEIIRTCRKIDRMIPITTDEEQNYIDFCEFNFDTGEKLTCRRK